MDKQTAKGSSASSPDSPYRMVSTTTIIEMGWRESGGSEEEKSSPDETTISFKACVEEPSENSTRKSIIQILDHLDGQVNVQYYIKL